MNIERIMLKRLIQAAKKRRADVVNGYGSDCLEARKLAQLIEDAQMVYSPKGLALETFRRCKSSLTSAEWLRPMLVTGNERN